MTDKDRELLEKAAKAAGKRIDRWHKGSPLVPHDTENRCITWNPLQDDGDAVRLAVKLGIHVEPRPKYHEVTAWAFTGGGAHEFMEINDDMDSAMRLTIVRAAAFIGEKA